jgi:hypothetical protein
VSRCIRSDVLHQLAFQNHRSFQYRDLFMYGAGPKFPVLLQVSPHLLQPVLDTKLIYLCNSPVLYPLGTLGCAYPGRSGWAQKCFSIIFTIGSWNLAGQKVCRVGFSSASSSSLSTPGTGRRQHHQTLPSLVMFWLWYHGQSQAKILA